MLRLENELCIYYNDIQILYLLLLALPLLPHQTQSLDHSSIRIKLFALHVIQELASSCEHSVHSSLIVMILLVFGHVRLHLLNACRQRNNWTQRGQK